MIEVNNVTKSFKKIIKKQGLSGSIKALFNAEHETIFAVKDVSFSIDKGEILGFIGPNGAGKSTVIKMLTGILTPTSGTCIVDGYVPYKERKEYVKQIGVVFGQRTQLWWDLPLVETFVVLKEIYDVSDSDYKKRLDFLTETLGLDNFIKSPVRTLSLGQRMRADMAAAMLHNPKILFLDEPTIGLDVVVKDSIRKAIRKVNNESDTTIILTTHDLQDIEELSTRILMIDKGSIVYNGTTEKIKSQYGTSKDIILTLEQAGVFLPFNEHFKLTENDLHISYDGGTIIIKYNTSKVSSSDILSYALKNVQVKDIAIRDIDIEDIIKKMYGSGAENEKN